MLAKVDQYNVEAEKIKEEGRRKLKQKMECDGVAHRSSGMRILAGCNKLWAVKSRQARSMGPTEDDEEHGGNGDDDDDECSCNEEKNEEIMKFRMHQFIDNPKMRLTGEEMRIAM